MGIGSSSASGLKARILSVLMAVAAAGCGLPERVAAAETADALYRNGVVYTVDNSATVAQAIAVKQGRISYVGSNEGAAAVTGPATRVVDLHGRMLMPGLIDGHLHPVEAGLDLLKCDLDYESLTVAEFQKRIQGCLDRDGHDSPTAWFEAAHWFRYGMNTGTQAVTRALLDSLRTQRPIIVHDSFGHSSLANSRALTLAKISAGSKDPTGGRIGRDAAGNPDGLLEDSAQEIVEAFVPAPTAEDRVVGARKALERLRRQGVTSFLDAIGDEPDIVAFRALEVAGDLTARAHLAPRITPAEAFDVDSAKRAVARVVALAAKYDQGLIRPAPSVSVRHTKLFMDGVINAPANTGALLDPYFVNHGTPAAPKFEPGRRGDPDVYFPAPVLKVILTGLGEHNIDPHLHTDGDWAVRAGFDGVEAMRAALPGRDIRPAFAHCELVDPVDYPRFAALNVTAVLSFQWGKPANDTIEGTRDTLGARRQALIEPSGSLAAHGARIAFGSDWPVDPLDEWFALQVGVTRAARPGVPPEHSGRLGQDPGLSRAAVLEAITRNAAYELHDERFVGSLEVGKLADFIVLDQNVATTAPDKIAATKVLHTVVGGRIVYDNGELARQP
jgi:predicted amidohydrolase YtcJ